MKLIDKDAALAEIDKRIKVLQKHPMENHKTICHLDSVKQSVNSLKAKEVDLEEKATQLSQKYFPNEENIWARPNIEAQRCKSACVEMVEWFKAQKGE